MKTIGTKHPRCETPTAVVKKAKHDGNDADDDISEYEFIGNWCLDCGEFIGNSQLCLDCLNGARQEHVALTHVEIIVAEVLNEIIDNVANNKTLTAMDIMTQHV